jgi:hypothetical protein
VDGAAVLVRVQPPVCRQNEVVGVPEARCVQLHRAVGFHDSLVPPVVSAEWIMLVGIAVARLVVECRQVVRRLADPSEVDRKHRCGQRVLGQAGEVM